MTATPKELYKTAMKLDPEDRADLVGLLLGSLEIQPDGGAEAAWFEEIDLVRRDREAPGGHRFRGGRDGSVDGSEIPSFLGQELVDLQLHPDAERELRTAGLWYLDRSFLVAEAFQTESNHAMNAVAKSLDRWPLISLIYRSRSELIEVIAVAHQKREPGYWSKR